MSKDKQGGDLPLGITVQKMGEGLRTTVVDLESGAQVIYEVLQPDERAAFRLLAAAFNEKFLDEISDSMERMADDGTD